MKRKKFIKTFGLGLVGVYAIGLEACKKPTINVTSPKIISPEIDEKNGGGVPPIVINDTIVVEGYVDKLSFNQGETIKIYINAKAEDQVNIGIYDSSGNLKDHVKGKFGPQSPGPDAYKNGYQYPNFVTFTIPQDFKSGLYFISKKIPFVVKNKARSGNIVAVLPSNTDNAYNAAGGLSSYSTPMSGVLSFQRPYQLYYWSSEFWAWAEKLPYQIDYIIDQDLDDYANFSYAKILTIPGHNEYWTRIARSNFDKFVASGKHALILSGNTMWWQIRYSDDGNEMHCFKYWGVDPKPTPELKTVNWYQDLLKYPIEESIGVNFNNGGYGDYTDDGWDGFKIVSENSPLLRGTNLKNGDVMQCISKEYDGAPIKYEVGNPHPVLDNIFNFHKIELIGYDYGFRVVKTVGTFIVLQKTPTSGIIVNTATTDWCSPRGMGGKDGAKIKQITLNAINLLLNDGKVFSS